MSTAKGKKISESAGKRTKPKAKKSAKKKRAKPPDSLMEAGRAHLLVTDREGVCIFCGQTTRHWWTFNGSTGECKCYECQAKGLV